MIFLIISSLALILLVILQTPNGKNASLTAVIGAKGAKNYLSKATWLMVVSLLVFTLVYA